MPGVDWSGIEAEKETGWQRKVHIFSDPFYYIEYGLAQLGALQVWQNVLKDQPGAVATYRRGLSLGSGVTLPQLYATSGAEFSFDKKILRQAVELILETISDLERDIH